jgi:coenzyme Q-binding protein COQ10
MPDFATSRYVAHGADEMFRLVADVERYPEFVPFCQGNPIRSRGSRGDVELVTTEMTVAHLMFRESYRSFVTLDQANGRILVTAGDGPLRRLDGRWSFRGCGPRRCEVNFSISYEFTSRMLTPVMGPVLAKAFGGYIQVFERRADAIYGPAQHVSSAPDIQPGLPLSAGQGVAAPDR